MGIDLVKDYLNEAGIKEVNQISNKMLEYFDILYEENQKVNLVSRKTLKEDYWPIHFLDSILPVKYFDMNGAKILDFGTGGGLPGIPLKIIFPKSKVYLLDSRQKKISAIDSFIKKLDLEDCFTIVSRLEELGHKWLGQFDFIVCRSVRITDQYARIMLKLLKKNGKIILYKSVKLDDIDNFSNTKLIDVSHSKIGVRNLVIVEKVKNGKNNNNSKSKRWRRKDNHGN